MKDVLEVQNNLEFYIELLEKRVVEKVIITINDKPTAVLLLNEPSE